MHINALKLYNVFVLYLLKKTYIWLESIKGKNLLYLVIGTFIVFLLMGILLGYITNFVLKINERQDSSNTENQVDNVAQEVSYEGKIKYVDPRLYPEDNISFVLVDNSGKEIILLKSEDQKLTVAENQYVTVYGILEKTADNKDVLFVDRIGIKNAAD